jgi:hypothetical protein
VSLSKTFRRNLPRFERRSDDELIIVNGITRFRHLNAIYLPNYSNTKNITFINN